MSTLGSLEGEEALLLIALIVEDFVLVILDRILVKHIQSFATGVYSVSFRANRDLLEGLSDKAAVDLESLE